MTFIAETVAIFAQNRNEAKVINENALLSEKIYRKKLTELLIKFVDFMFSDNQFVIDIRSELIIRDENTIIH